MLRRFMADHPQIHSKTDKAPSGNKSSKLEVLREIKVIIGEPVGDEESNFVQKAHSWKVRVSQGGVYSIDRPRMLPRVDL